MTPHGGQFSSEYARGQTFECTFGVVWRGPPSGVHGRVFVDPIHPRDRFLVPVSDVHVPRSWGPLGCLRMAVSIDHDTKLRMAAPL